MKPTPQNQDHHQAEEHGPPFKDNADICQQLMDRYAKSSAPQHRHLLATAAAMRSILSAESLPLTPLAYFAAAISALDSALTSQTMDPTSVSAALTFLSIVLPVVPSGGLAAGRASEAVGVLVGLLDGEGEKLQVASVRSGVKCLGVLILGSSALEDWNSLQLGFESLLKFSIDKRPKIRRCAQECLEKVVKSLQSSSVIEEASNSVYSFFKNYMPVAMTLSSTKSIDGSKGSIKSKSEHVEVVHMLNVLKLTIPYHSVKVCSNVLSGLCKLMTSRFSPLTREILKAIEGFFETSSNEIILPEMENIITFLTEYVSLGKNNPMDTVMQAATLLKSALDKQHAVDSRSWIKNLPVACGSLAGLLTYEDGNASQASTIIKELIDHHIDLTTLMVDGIKSFGSDSEASEEANAIKSTCSIFEVTIKSCDGIPNEHILAVVSVLFQKLGEFSHIFLRSILVKLANLMTPDSGGSANNDHLQDCMGSAVIAMGSCRILELLPISLCVNDFTCPNIWLVPILKKHVVGASLGYYMEHIVPLAKSFRRASRKVKKSENCQQLQACAQDLWKLLPAFCRYPSDMEKKIGSLAKLLVSYLNKYSFMQESIAVALQVLVNQNKSILSCRKDVGGLTIYSKQECAVKCGSMTSYSEKTAAKNIRALASCSVELLQALIDVYINSVPGACSYLKDAIGCLASITDSSTTEKLFMSLLKKLKLINSEGKFESQGESHESIDIDQEKLDTTDKHLQRCVVMDIASCLVESANKDFVDLIYSFVRHAFQGSDEIGHCEAYHTLSRVLEEHAWFCSTHFLEVIDLSLGLTSPVDMASLRSRFACYRILMVHAIKMSLEEEIEKAFLILNEIILTLKDEKEEPRKAAYDVLLTISTTLRSSSSVGSDAPYHKLITLIMGYLSGSSPHLKSGAVSVLSVLVYNDPDICLSMPNLVSTLLSLLESKTIEVIKAVLGFMKVLVSSLQAKDLQNLLSDVASGILPWSFVSRHHFRSKVTVILEIMIRKCGRVAVELVTPDKYKGFLKGVLENRHVKTSSKEGATDSETLLAESSAKRVPRKDKESSNLPSENSLPEHRKRKRGKKLNSNLSGSTKPFMSAGEGLKLSKRARHNGRENSMKVGSEGSGRKQKKYFNQGPLSGRKRKLGRRA